MEEIEETNGVDDFSFVCLNPDGSPISAEDAFVNGQIRHEFPMFHQRILTHDVKQPPSTVTDDPAGVSPEIYCEWSPPKLGKKSYSTGFSKLWRFGDKIRRSRSEGKEAFEFLRSASSGSGKGGGSSGGEKAEMKKGKEVKGKGKGKGEVKGETASYYHERHYARNRTESEMNKRKSYLPYRSNLMGFFSTPNSLNRNF